MNKIKQNIGWLYGALLAVSLLPLLWWWPNGPVYVGKIVLIQVAALAGSYLMFRKLYDNPLAILLGSTLYVTSPWRFDLCFVQNKPMLSLVWALVPFCLYAMLCAKEKSIRERRGLSSLALAAVVLAVIGYGSEVMFCLMAALILLTALCFRKPALLLSVAGGAVLWLPGNLDFLRYLFTDYAADFGVPLQNITPKGYVLLDFMTSYVYLDGKPGLGLGLMLMLAIFFYVRFVREKPLLTAETRLFGAVGAASLLLATRYFPWEILQRLGSWALKFVSLLDTPALFVGFAALLLPTMAVSAVDPLDKEQESLPAAGALLITWTAAIAIAAYRCYMLIGG